MIDSLEQIVYKPVPFPKKIYSITNALLLLGLIGVVLSFVLSHERASFNLVIVIAFLTSIGAASLFFIGIEYLTGAVWSVPFRRIAERFANVLFVVPLLGIVVLLDIHSVFHWSHTEALETDAMLKAKEPYLNFSFFVIRFFVFSFIWILFAILFKRNSVKQDITKDQLLTKKNIALSAFFMPIFAITSTFFAIDWLMSLEPHWYSTIFGVYYFSGSVLAALSVFTFASVTLNENGFLVKGLKVDHYYSMGALLFAFTNFWAYIAFSQFMLIWYANLPEETFWFIARGEGSWLYWSIGLIFVKFVVPYIFLLPQPSKMNPRKLKIASLWILGAHYYDLYWIVMPTFSKGSIAFSWIEISFIIFAIGLILSIFLRFETKQNLVPIGDPKLKRALEFHL